MCDQPKAFNTLTRKARKDHKCCECQTTIKKGDSYQYSSGVWDGPDSFKQCLRCFKLSQLVINENDGGDCLAFHELQDWFLNQECQGFNLDHIISFYCEKWSLQLGDFDGLFSQP